MLQSFGTCVPERNVQVTPDSACASCPWSKTAPRPCQVLARRALVLHRNFASCSERQAAHQCQSKFLAMGGDGFQTQKRKSWIPGQVRAGKVLADAITVDKRKE